MPSPVIIVGDSANIVSDARSMVQSILTGTSNISHGDAAGAFAALAAVASYWQPMAAQLVPLAAAATLTADFAKLQNAINSGNFDQGVDAALGLVGGIGGLLALSPVPQTKALGIAVAALANAAKELYKNRSDIAAALDDIYRTLDEPSVYVPATYIDPQTLIDHGLLDPNTLLPRIDPTKFDVNDYPEIRRTRTPQGRVTEVVRDRTREALTPPRPPGDPLALDLDGDGLETIGIPTNGSSPIVFDHNADGIRTGTGWVLSDDAWLALDRNGNGSIDSGRELFGVDTLITNANGTVRTARDGFEALATLDANADGVFDASDAAFADVRVWRDLNQDGISQAGELASLSAHGITAIGLTPTGGTTNLGNGNVVTGRASVTRSNGSTTDIDSVAVSTEASNLDVALNPFYRQFSDSVPLTAAAQALPEMGGSGVVRDLREAMSLGNAPRAIWSPLRRPSQRAEHAMSRRAERMTMPVPQEGPRWSIGHAAEGAADGRFRSAGCRWSSSAVPPRSPAQAPWRASGAAGCAAWSR